jgi:hypothetical protein
LSIGGIRVSTICCPACSRLFHHLLYDEEHDNKDQPKILTQALASHSVPYPVQLPQWLPDNIVSSMVTSFRPLLVHELELLAYPGIHSSTPLSPTDKVHRSQQSQSNIRVGRSNAEATSTSEMTERFTRCR